jgi:hypothetical protein
MTFNLRDYQQQAVAQGKAILEAHGILILNYEVRLGKTHIALSLANIAQRNTLFVTKKKAISSIEKDVITGGYTMPITITNYEQLHKLQPIYDFIILDESHCLGAFPKPSLRAKQVRRLCTPNAYKVLMSGTLMPESNAQIFHQLWAAGVMQTNFYKWHKAVGIAGVIRTSYGEAIDYSNVPYERVKELIKDVIITKTQSEAGFASKINEHILTVKMQDSTYKAIKRLEKDKVIESKSGLILADTAVKEMQKVHQMYSGTILFEDGSRVAFDTSKAAFIAQQFRGKKMAIFYKFIAELEAIKQHLDVTQDIEEFNTTDKHIALQIVSGREGINLSKADVLVYYNIDFSAVSYWQSRDRMTTIDRQQSDVYWIFAENGIEHNIYKAVINKRDFTLQTFKSWQANTNQK